MTLQLLTSADYPAIRAAIRSDVGVSDLPDALIGYAIGPATSQVAALDKSAPWPDGSAEAQRDHDAAVLYAAAILAGSLPQIVSEKFEDYSVTMAQFNIADRVAMLRLTAAILLAENLGESAVDLLRAGSMTLARGGRGDISRPEKGSNVNLIGQSGMGVP